MKVFYFHRCCFNFHVLLNVKNRNNFHMPINSPSLTALVFGGSGLVGSQLVSELMLDDQCSSIVVFSRKPMELNHPKITEHVVDFTKLERVRDLLQGDELYICLGTTIKKAGSVKAVEAIDRDLPLLISRIAYENGVRKIAVVSSMGANAGSRNFYVRIKGEMEKGVMQIPFDKKVIARPSMLLGDRKEFRFGEAVGKVIMKGLSFLMIGGLRKYRGITDTTVARALVTLIRSSNQEIIFESDILQEKGRE